MSCPLIKAANSALLLCQSGGQQEHERASELSSRDLSACRECNIHLSIIEYNELDTGLLGWLVDLSTVLMMMTMPTHGICDENKGKIGCRNLFNCRI